MQPVTTSGHPLFNTSIWIHNELPDKPLRVIVSPNPDYYLADIYVGIAGLISGGMGMITSTSSFFLLLRSLSFLRNGVALRNKLAEELHKISFVIPPREPREVFDALTIEFAENLFTKPLSTIAGLFGGSTVTLIIMDETLENVVMFNSSSGQQYYADKIGVRDPMHVWNIGGLPMGKSSNLYPSLVQMNNKLLLFYRQEGGNQISYDEFQEGVFKTRQLNQDSSTGTAPTVLENKLCLVGRDGTGKQMFALWDRRQEVPEFTRVGEKYHWLGVDTDGKPSATTMGTTMGDTVFVVARRAVNSFPKPAGVEIVWAKFRADGNRSQGKTGISTRYVPALHAYKGKLVMVYVHPDSKGLCLATSTNGEQWTVIHHNGLGIKGHPATSTGVALTVYKDRLYIFYRDVTGNAVYYLWTEDGVQFKWPLDSHDSHASYFGLNISSMPTAAPMPGENNGIMVAGIIPEGSFFSFKHSKEMVYTIFEPYEPR